MALLPVVVVDLMGRIVPFRMGMARDGERESANASNCSHLPYQGIRMDWMGPKVSLFLRGEVLSGTATASKAPQARSYPELRRPQARKPAPEAR